MDPFIAAICQHPDDDLPRLIYADWLEERGNSRGEFIRLQCAHHAGKPVDLKRMSELETTYGRKWAMPFTDWAYMVGFRRGFPEHLVIPADVFVDFADDIFTIAPVTGVSLMGAARKLRRILVRPAIQHLRAMHLTGTRIGDRGVHRLAKCPHLQPLQTLRLGHCQLTNNSVQSLCESKMLLNVTELDLSDNRMTGDSIPMLANSEWLQRLRKLDLRNNEFKTGEIAKLRQIVPATCQFFVDRLPN